MITFGDLTVRNFLTFKNIRINLKDRGLVLVLGENKDAPKASSNGAGKSAILDAICWCLWGKTIRGLTHDEVINRQAKKDCFVGLDVHTDTDTYTVVRTRKNTDKLASKPNDLLLYKNGELLTLPTGNVQEAIDTLLKMDFDLFRYIMIGSKVKVAELTDASIKELLENLLNTQVVAKAQKLAKDRVRALSLTKARLETSLKHLETSIESYEKEVTDAVQKSKSFEQDREQQVIARQKDLDECIQDKTVCQQHVDENKDLQTLYECKLDERDRKHLHLATIKQGMGLCKDDLVKYSTQRAGLEKARSAAVAKVTTKIENLNKLGSTCDFCGSELTTDHLEKQKNHLQAEHLRVYEEYSPTIREITEFHIPELEERQMLLMDQHKAARRELDNIEAELERLNNRRVKFADTTARIQILDRAIQSYTRELEKIKAAENAWADVVSSILEKNATAVSKWSFHKKELIQVDTEIKQLEYWIDSFSTKGLRNHMLRTVTPLLNASVAKYCKILTDDEMTVVFHTERQLKNGSTKEEFYIEVTQKHGGESYTGSSDGERARADLAIAFALGDLAQCRAGSTLAFRYLDEPFDAVDEQGQQAIMNLLTEQQAQYNTIFCVTHIPSFQQLFNNVIHVVKHKSTSTVRYV